MQLLSIFVVYNKWYICQIDFKKEATNTDKTKIKDELVLHGMTRATADKIEYSNIGAFQTSDSNTPWYYIFQWTGNAYNLQRKYTCHAFDPPVIITEGELVCPAKFIIPTRKIPIDIMIQMKQCISWWS